MHCLSDIVNALTSMLSPSTKEQPKSVQTFGSFLNPIETTAALASAASTLRDSQCRFL
jgi:hypothetical protein